MCGFDIGKHLIIIKSEITYTSDFIYLQDDCPGPPLRPFYQNFHDKSGVKHERKVEPHPLPMKTCDFSFGMCPDRITFS